MTLILLSLVYVLISVFWREEGEERRREGGREIEKEGGKERGGNFEEDNG